MNAPGINFPATITDVHPVIASDPESQVFPIRIPPLDVGVGWRESGRQGAVGSQQLRQGPVSFAA